MISYVFFIEYINFIEMISISSQLRQAGSTQ